MKKKLKVLIEIVFRSIYRIYNLETSIALSYRIHYLYSLWLKNSFRVCGKDLLIQSPAYIKGSQYITIGDCFYSLGKLRIECWDNYNGIEFTPEVIIGNNVCMNYNVHIGCINKILIGNDVLLASNIYISDHNHGSVTVEELDIPPSKRDLVSKGSVIIGNNVWIGENVSIMPDVIIGENCIIGANSVVTKSFPKNSVIAGVPAKIIKALI